VITQAQANPGGNKTSIDRPAEPFILPLFSRIRRNHALEHATMHILSERVGRRTMVGRSSFWGFKIYGHVSTEDVITAAQEGLRHLQTGRWEMAVHPNCGSNIALAGTLAALGAFVAMSGKRRSWRQRLARLPMAVSVAILGILVAQPLGPLFQAYITTQPAVGSLRITDVTRERRGNILIHSICTEV
jgi:hypothetical protein